MGTVLIASSKKERETIFLEIYQQCFPPIASYIQRMGGTLEEAKDIFQESLVIYYENVLAEKLNIHSDEESYLFGIVKNLWRKRFRERQMTVALDSVNVPLPEASEYQPSPLKLMVWLESIGKKCLNLLKSFYYDKQSMDEIAGELGFTSSHSASVQKYKCIEKIRNKIKAKNVSYEDFLE